MTRDGHRCHQERCTRLVRRLQVALAGDGFDEKHIALVETLRMRIRRLHGLDDRYADVRLSTHVTEQSLTVPAA